MTLVFIPLGGVESKSKGLESWNPSTGQVQTLWKVLPQEEGKTFGLKGSKALAIKGGTEVIFYGGSTGSIQAGIWKYTVDTNQWDFLGNMTSRR